MTPTPDLPLGIRWSDRVPLGRLSAATWLLQRDTAQVRELIETGTLLWAWDLRSRDSERREIRLWRPCVDAFARGEAQPADGEAAVMKHILPDGREWFGTQEMGLRWMCSHKHILKLLDDGLLTALDGSPRRRGAGGSPHITRASAEALLRGRRVM